MLDDLAVDHPDDGYLLVTHLAPRAGHAEERTAMRARDFETADDEVALRHRVRHVGAQVGESAVECLEGRDEAGQPRLLVRKSVVCLDVGREVIRGYRKIAAVQYLVDELEIEALVVRE